MSAVCKLERYFDYLRFLVFCSLVFLELKKILLVYPFQLVLGVFYRSTEG